MGRIGKAICRFSMNLGDPSVRQKPSSHGADRDARPLGPRMAAR
jgi:hypothetical protein